ncbi:hypothetical protein GGX14DRAFT_439352 [Mycena pura]|uniref:DASH complex subunit DUO1 n=1 Tax=Mycena pura TaxID=153505 RepID=A0AAD6VND9_9AGAR|nr:hypothetical protein GGX14DRAFT_439352 [Mycena pura]
MTQSESGSILFSSRSNILSEAGLPSTSILSSEMGPGEDLSISELSLSVRPGGVSNDNDSAIQYSDELGRTKKVTGKLRDEKLHHDLFVLRKLNAAVTSFNDALRDVGSQNERVATQLEQTEGLLNKYVSIVSESEEFARLMFDDEWQGAEADELMIAQQQREAERIAREEHAAAAQRLQERLEQEERERVEQKEREQAAKEKQERAKASGGIRGVRGTRASMRTTRGMSRGATSSSAGRGSTTRGLTRQT